MIENDDKGFKKWIQTPITDYLTLAPGFLLYTFIKKKINSGGSGGVVPYFKPKIYINKSGVPHDYNMNGVDFYRVVENYLPEIFAQDYTYKIQVEYIDYYSRIFLINENDDFESESDFSYKDYDCDLIDNPYIVDPEPPLLDGYIFLESVFIEKLTLDQPGIYIPLSKYNFTYNQYNRTLLTHPGDLLVVFKPNVTINGIDCFTIDYNINRLYNNNTYYDISNDCYYYIHNNFTLESENQDIKVQITYLTTNDKAVYIHNDWTSTGSNRNLGNNIFNKSIYITNFTNDDDITPQSINLQEKIVTLNENVTDYIVEPDIGWEGLSSVQINTNISSNVQEVKTFNITQPITTNVLPDTGYQSMSRVFLNWQVPTELKQLTVTQNGTITISPENGNYFISSVRLTTNVPPSSPRLEKIVLQGYAPYTFNITSLTWTRLNSASINVGYGKTIIALQYTSNNTILRVRHISQTGSGNDITMDFADYNNNPVYYISYSYIFSTMILQQSNNTNIIKGDSILKNVNNVTYVENNVYLYYSSIDYPLQGELNVN